MTSIFATESEIYPENPKIGVPLCPDPRASQACRGPRAPTPCQAELQRRFLEDFW